MDLEEGGGGVGAGSVTRPARRREVTKSRCACSSVRYALGKAAALSFLKCNPLGKFSSFAELDAKGACMDAATATCVRAPSSTVIPASSRFRISQESVMPFDKFVATTPGSMLLVVTKTAKLEVALFRNCRAAASLLARCQEYTTWQSLLWQ